MKNSKRVGSAKRRVKTEIGGGGHVNDEQTYSHSLINYLFTHNIESSQIIVVYMINRSKPFLNYDEI